MLDTDYLGKGRIARKAPFYSVTSTLELFGAELGSSFARIKNIFSEQTGTI